MAQLRWDYSALNVGVKTLLAATLTVAAAVLAGASCRTPATEVAERPNVLLIVADDLGYADLGAFGGDIQTPNIDDLARQGVLFTQFHTAPMCAPTRAMLLSGNNNHVAGIGRQSTPLDIPGYEGHLSDRVALFPGLMRDAGYHTVMAGKWHVGVQPEHGPAAKGFARSYSLIDGAGSHYSSVGFFDGGSLYRYDGREVSYPEGAYTTELFTDSLLAFIDDASDAGKPFVAFASYTSPHWPLQVPDAYLDKYVGHYDAGYDMLRHERFLSLQAAGIVAATAELPPRNEVITPWTALDESRQRVESRKMELYAAMVENLDHHVGRLVEHLKTSGLYDNTLIVFMSDNGAAAEDFYNEGEYSAYLQANYDNSFDNMGRPNSWVSYGAPWAEAGSAPFSRRKEYTREGGLVAPLIVAGHGVGRHGEIDRSYVTVMDIAPTLLAAGRVAYPDDGSVQPLLGSSLLPVLSDRQAVIHPDDYVTTLLHYGRAFVRSGDWKLVTLEPPFSEEAFELYNVADDPGETTNLATTEPQRYAEMLALWQSETRRLGIEILTY